MIRRPMLFLLAALLTGSAPAAEPRADWRPLPDIPTRDHWVADYLEHLDLRVGGAHASPLLQDARSRVQTAQALSLFDPAPPGFQHATGQDPDQVLSLLGAASAGAAEDYVVDASTADFADAHAVLGTPNLTVSLLRGLDTGSSLRLRGWSEEQDVPLLDAAVFARTHRPGLGHWQVSALTLSRQWMVSTRHRIHDQLFVFGSVRSASLEGPVQRVSADPASWSFGTVSPATDGSWQVAARFTRWRGAPDRLPEDRAMIELRRTLRLRPTAPSTNPAATPPAVAGLD